jgi:site-specific DNA recombinase
MKHFIYSRKSSEDDDRQALSIVAQLSELNSIAAANNLSVLQTFTESKSAKEPGREIFNEMLRRIEGGEANAILSWKLDRLARNFDDGGRIIGMLQRGVIKEIRTFEKTYLPGDNVLMIAMEFGMANQYVRDLSINIRRGIREKVRRGIACSKAPLGYYNEPRLRTIEPHPTNFEKLKGILELFATGEYSLSAIQREMTIVGLVGDRSKKPLTFGSIDHILRKPFYCGVFGHKGELHQGSHPPMISKKTFDQIQEALATNGKPRHGRRTQKGFLFLGFARCGSCGYGITGERKIKKSGLKFFYYRCTHKNRRVPCTDRGYTPQGRFESEVRRNVELVCLPDEWKDKFWARVEGWSKESLGRKQEQIGRLKSELSSLKSKIQRLNTAFTEGTIEIDEFKEMKNPLVPQKIETEQRIIRLQTTHDDRLEPLRNWILEANQAVKWAAEENWLEMKSFLQRVGSNRLLHAKTLTVSFKKPWNYLAKTAIAVRGTESLLQQNSLMVDRVGFEPPVGLLPRSDFESSAEKNATFCVLGCVWSDHVGFARGQLRGDPTGRRSIDRFLWRSLVGGLSRKFSPWQRPLSLSSFFSFGERRQVVQFEVLRCESFVAAQRFRLVE